MDWKERLRLYALAREPMLVYGETGVGKDLAAREVHRLSTRSGGPFVVLDCGAVPVSLLEAELFGVESGAFTGAMRRRGLAEQAEGGTLFLDEIGELPLVAQAALLRFMDSGECRRVGGARPRCLDVRVVAATNRDLRAEVAQGRFREDLYHRLAVLRVEVPPLRRRTDEIESLVFALAPKLRLTEQATARLRSHPWPGNVRELRAVLARAQAMLNGSEVQSADLELDDPVMSRPIQMGSMRSAKEDMIRRAMERSGGNVRAAARELGISHTTIYRALGDG